MRWLLVIFLLSLEVVAVEVCVELEAEYALDQLKMQERTVRSGRIHYDEANALIDSAIAYLGYCVKEISLDKQYQIRSDRRCVAQIKNAESTLHKPCENIIIYLESGLTYVRFIKMVESTLVVVAVLAHTVPHQECLL